MKSATDNISPDTHHTRGSAWKKLYVLAWSAAWGVGYVGGVFAGQPAPVLPTACLAGNCGSVAQSFVQYGSAGLTTSGNSMTITQTTNQAILNWANFNIANGYSVQFVQPSATSEVLNNIWSADPSVIAGKLTSNGEVFLYNQNGIVFGNGAQVNVGGLVASSLAFGSAAGSADPYALFKSGILSNNLNTTLAGTLPAAFQAAPGGVAGDIVVANGASLESDGGRIMLLGSAVMNQGSISTPGGQTILGAGQSVYLAASSDPSLRGLLIAVNSGGTQGAVINQGQISADRGNVTLAGMVVNQEGLISATTSVSANGSIYLIAGDTSSTTSPAFVNPSSGAFGGLMPNTGGTLTLGSGSVTEVLPDADTSTITAQNLDSFISSKVDLVGQSVSLLGNATIRAPGGAVTMNAALNPYVQFEDILAQQADADGGRIYLDSNSVIDVSGLSGVSAQATSNIVNVTLEGIDLQDDPLLRNSFLHGQSVTVNLAQGSTLFNVAPYAGNVALTDQQIMTGAGTINLNSDGDVIARAGSTLNVSGGSTAYQGGFAPSTTELLATNGKVYNIGDAPNTLNYVAVVSQYANTDQTWGTVTKIPGQTYYAGYTQGGNAGTISVVAPQMYLMGSMLGNTVSGIHQLTAATMPQGAQLDIGCACKSGSSNDYMAPGVELLDGMGDTLGSNFDYANIGNGLPVSLQGTVVLSPSALGANGFSHLSIYSNGEVSLPAGATLNLGGEGSLLVNSLQQVEVDGSIVTPGGTVALATQTTSDFDNVPHNVVLGAGALIDTSGAWTNNSEEVTQAPASVPVILNGGNISLSAQGNVILGNGSELNASGGAAVATNNQITDGSAGNIKLLSSYQTSADSAYLGSVQLGSGVTLSGASLANGKGGSLTIATGSLTIGDAANGSPGELVLSPEFFNNQGFSQYNLTGENGVLIGSTVAGAPQVTIYPVQNTLQFTGNPLLEATGSSLASFTHLTALPESERKAANLSFTSIAAPLGADNGNEGNIVLGQNAVLETDPGGNVSLLANSNYGSIDVLGSIIAPGGNILLQIESPKVVASPSGYGYVPGQEILLGSNATLDAAGYADTNTLNPNGYTEGAVLAGGTVSLQAYKGYVVTQAGSLINVSGAAGVLDEPSTNGIVPVTVASNAGVINIDAREGIVLQGSLLGQAATYNGAAVPGAAGGALSIGLDLYDYAGTLSVDSGNPVIPYSLAPRTLTISNQGAAALDSSLVSGQALISSGTLNSGGFDSVTLKSADVISVSGDVSLRTRGSITVDAPVLQGQAGSDLQLSSAYVALGNYFNQVDYFEGAPTVTVPNPNAPQVLSSACAVGATCNATFEVNAQQIDIRGVSGWSGFATETLDSSGSIRFVGPENMYETAPTLAVPAGDPSLATLRGALSTSGDLTLQAQQIYPTTGTDFTVTSGATVSILPGQGTGAAPLSAGGILTINAQQIDQGGTLLAPSGEINLTAPDINVLAGSVTSVSDQGLEIPYGSTLNGQQWTYSPVPGVTEIISAPPAKAINLDGANVSINQGATLDLSGGGDLYAYEWIAGSGGSKDVLSGGGMYQYAIVPTLGSQFAPIDGQYQQGSSVTGTQTIYLSGVPGLAAGYYALLPARYAVLPGAFAIDVLTSDSNAPLGVAVEESNGAYLTGAKFGVAGTNDLSSLSSTVLVAPSSTVRDQSQYTNSYANAFFTAAASGSGSSVPSLPADAGQLAIGATGTLALNGTIDFAVGSFQTGTNASGQPIVEQGIGGDVSIQAPIIDVVDTASTSGASAPAGAVLVSAQSLDNLHAQTIVLGGSLQDTSAGEVLTVGATQTVQFDNDTVALSTPQLLVAAKGQVAVDSGALISSTGSFSTPDRPLVLQGAGALMRVSSGGGQLLSTSASSEIGGGALTIDSGASVTATGSLLLYSSADTTADSGSTLTAPALELYSSRISVGAVASGSNSPAGLDITSQLLSQFTGLTSLVLGSTSSIDFYGGVNLGAPGGVGAGLQNVTLDAAAVNGYGAGNTVIQAGTISLQNSSTSLGVGGNPYLNVPSGTGDLLLRAVASGSAQPGEIVLGSGDKTLAGFSTVTMQADGLIEGHGTGTLTLADAAGTGVPLTLQASALTMAAGGTQSLYSNGAVSILPGPSTGNAPIASALGGSLSIQGSAISDSGLISVEAGQVQLHATTGNVLLGAGADIEAGGTAQNFTVTNAVSPGGQVSLLADNGNVQLSSGSIINVSGASSANGQVAGAAGALLVSASSGQFIDQGATLEGSAASGQAQGNFTLDVGSGLGSGGLAALQTLLAQGGFTGALSFRSRGDAEVDVTGNVVASSYQLAVDQGTIDLSGEITTGGGAIGLWAGTGLTVSGGAQLNSSATSAGPVGVNGQALAGSGGNITLGTAAGTLSIDGGSAQQPTIFNLAGYGSAAADGTLILRAPRTADDTSVQIATQNTQNLKIGTSRPVIVEGFKAYEATDLGGVDVGCGSGGSCDVADTGGMLFTDAATFEANAGVIAIQLGLANVVQVRPGIEVDSTGDLVLDNTTNGTGAWDLDSWNVALGAPVNVTLRAAGNLIFNSSLTDGFSNNGQAVAQWNFGEAAANIDSGSYRLTAGADLAGANPLVVVAVPYVAQSTAGTPNSGNVILTPGNLIRTGDGTIDVAAGGDVLLGYNFNGYDAGGVLQVSESDPLTSTIYTAGVPLVLTAGQSTLFTPPVIFGDNPYDPAYPTGGGNVTISAAGDVISSPSNQVSSDWQWRRGVVSSNGYLVSPANNASWWIDFGNFEQGIGALGGGNVSVTAGHNIVDVSAVIPTTGELLGAAGTLPLASNLVLTGGGTLTVQAGGNILSGVYQDDWGNAQLSAGGNLGSASTIGQELQGITQAQLGALSLNTPIYPVILTGAGSFDVDARTGVVINWIANSTVVPETSGNFDVTRPAADFYTYTPTSAVSIATSSGELVMMDTTNNLPVGLLNQSHPQLRDDAYVGTGGNGVAYPGTVSLAALSGDISLLNSGLMLFPSADGNLSVLAEGSITGSLTQNLASPFSISVAESNPASWANPLAPSGSFAAPAVAANLPATPLFQNNADTIYVVADTGSLSTSTMSFPHAADIVAGGDIDNLTLTGKNLNPTDVTLIEAGGNINYSTPTAPITNALELNNEGISVSGPGTLEVLAGGSINLGDSRGIVTTGNLSDIRLPSGGAAVLAGAGFGAQSSGGIRVPDVTDFINTYLAPSASGTPSAYASALITFMSQFDQAGAPAPSYASALAGFKTLSWQQQLPLLSQVLTDELSITGIDHNTQGSDYSRGYTAINTLFPTQSSGGAKLDYSGDINLFFSQIKTEQGGNIDLMAPGGSVVVGVPNPPASLTQIKQSYNPFVSSAASLGLLVLGEGAIEGFANQDFEVNQSRILTLEGGDIILWASNGNIDAGQGAKTASGAPPPIIETDSSGNVIVNPVNDVNGSGIGQLLTGPGETAGLVNLIAPKGAVNAGDAGIRVAGNLNIAAVVVIGAGNITVGGTSTGVPSSEAGALSGALSGGNSLGDASKDAVSDLTQGLGNSMDMQQMSDSLQPVFITVKMFCLGIQCEVQ